MNTEPLTITIPNHRCPSWNTLYSGKHWRVRSSKKNEIRERVRYAFPDEVVDNAGHWFEVPVNITVTAHMKGRLIDADNVMAKYYIDALKDWVIPEDDKRYVNHVTTKCVKAKKDYVTITIEPVVQATKETA
jgi:Holliday junction resolvase RusA-like endonuclease